MNAQEMFKELDTIASEKYNDKPFNIRLENRIFTNQRAIREVELSKTILTNNHKKALKQLNIRIKFLNEHLKNDMKELGWIK
jgi:hypothetical protein